MSRFEVEVGCLYRSGLYSGASTPPIASDRLSQRLQLSSVLWFCVFDALFFAEIKPRVWKSQMILKQLNLFDCFKACLVLPWSVYWKVALFIFSIFSEIWQKREDLHLYFSKGSDGQWSYIHNKISSFHFSFDCWLLLYQLTLHCDSSVISEPLQTYLCHMFTELCFLNTPNISGEIWKVKTFRIFAFDALEQTQQIIAF